MTRLALILLFAVAVPVAAQAVEQGKSGDQNAVAHRPPPGMCRIWIDGVPAERQPAPTDCATAIRRRPSNAKVIFGDEVRPRTAVPHLVEPTRPTETAQPTDPRTNDPRVAEPRTNEPKTAEPNDPHAQPPRVVQQPAAHPPVRMPPRTVVKPHKPSGPPMGRIRIH
jgi:hypothetical protein